jgi:hypothetical protein
MQYHEKVDPGFSELTAENLGEEVLDNTKIEAIAEVKRQFARLGFDEIQVECMCHFQVGTTDLETVSCFELALFRDYLSRKFVVRSPQDVPEVSP